MSEISTIEKSVFARLKPYAVQLLEGAVMGAGGVVLGELYAITHPGAAAVPLLVAAAAVVVGGLVISRVFKI